MNIRSLFLAIMLLPVPLLFGQDDPEIRKALDVQYKKLAEANEREDLAAVKSLRTDDFHTIFPDGKVGDAKSMEGYSKQFFELNNPPYDIQVTIQKLDVSENKLVAVAEVFQQVSRTREMAGKVRKVDTSVLQREIWVKTGSGWKIKSVDNVRDHKRFVDGKRVDPSKPYDPEAPEYKP